MSVVFHTPTNEGEDMKVSKAIELLSELNPDEEICISWWERQLFTDTENVIVSEEKWNEAVAEFDIEGGYDSVNEQVWMNLNYVITGKGEF
jgi:hypothetical protein